MSLFDLIMTIFALGMLIFGIIWLFPYSLLILWPSPRCWFDKNFDRPVTSKKQETMRQLEEQIEGLGFRRLGIKVEKRLWLRATRLMDFASVQSRSFASIYVQKDKIKYYFFTPFSGGQMVLTANHVLLPATSGETLISSVPGPPNELLSLHQDRVQSLCAKGFDPYKEYTKETRLKATEQYYKSDLVRKQMRLAGWICLLLFMAICYFGLDILKNSLR